tara:strand:- start:1584 stop:1769 length:186 start_codon:yes stop_codon:yes gene_type:complete
MEMLIKKKEMKRPKLTLRQEKTMKKHSKHHSKNHLAFMKKLMLQGVSFGEAHKQAVKKIGK